MKLLKKRTDDDHYSEYVVSSISISNDYLKKILIMEGTQFIDFCYFEDINWLIHSLSRFVKGTRPYMFPVLYWYALDDIGSGSHVHLSLWENGKNVFMASGGHAKHGMSKDGEEFMAGVLNHLPSILAFTAPLTNSAAYQCWGKENREAPLRTACPPGVQNGVVSDFEIKAFDGCANPHLGLAAIIAAGIDGLRRHLSLPEPIGK
ncbi:unnamed protein product [Camellia sinensis]